MRTPEALPIDMNNEPGFVKEAPLTGLDLVLRLRQLLPSTYKMSSRAGVCLGGISLLLLSFTFLGRAARSSRLMLTLTQKQSESQSG